MRRGKRNVSPGVRHATSMAIVAALVAGGLALQTTPARGQALADYTAAPPFIDNVVKPNVFILLDNSGSMNFHTYAGAFSPTEDYTGLFDHAECYKYNATDEKFEPDPSANPDPMPAGGWTCQGNVTYEWSGNLLNYVAMRRFDIVKQALTGGVCTNMTPDGCMQVVGEQSFTQYQYIRRQSMSASLAEHRIPESIRPSSGDVHFYTMGTDTAIAGTFCVDAGSTVQLIQDDLNTLKHATTCSDGSDGYTETLYRIKIDLLAPAPPGIIQQVGSRVRFGLFLLHPKEGGYVAAEPGQGTTATLNAINNSEALQSTPMTETLVDGLRYLAQVGPPLIDPDAYTLGDPTRDPYYFAEAGGTVECCKTFVLSFSDGQTSNDQTVPAWIQDYGHAGHGPHCIAVDGSGDPDYNGVCANPDHHKTNYNSGSHFLDDVAYYGHVTDLRPSGNLKGFGDAGNDIPGMQNITVYSFYAFGFIGGRELSMKVAKNGGFEDKDNDGLGPNGENTPNLVEEWDRLNNITGAEGADGLPDTFYEASDPRDMRDMLVAALGSIIKRSGAGSSASVLASSSTGEGAVFQSFFRPSTVEGAKEVRWTGFTQGLFLDAFGNLREDTNGDGRLVYKDDNILEMFFDDDETSETYREVVVERYEDSDGNGLKDAALQKVLLQDVDALWEAGDILAGTAASARNIYTWIDQDHDGLVDGGEQIEFTTANKTDLSPYLRGAAATFTDENIIKFIRGEQVAGMRDRELSGDVWKLGDIIHSRPIVAGPPAQRYDLIYGDTSYTAFLQKYKERRQVVYVGANDGMLHAFNAGFFHRGDDPGTTGADQVEHGYFTTTQSGVTNTPPLGEELFGFIPQELLPHLKWLTRPDYSHVYYVDLTPKITEARIFTPDADHPNGWGTILMGGFRLGGSCGNCPLGKGQTMEVVADFNNDGDTVDADDTRQFYSAYFVLDITNPESSDYPKLLWSFTSPDLGFATTTPSMLRVNPSASSVTDDTNAKWYMVVGSGPTDYEGQSAQAGKLFAIDLEQGPGAGNSLVTTMTADSLDAFLADPVVVDRDFDYRVDAAYMGSVIHDGSLPWRGKLYRLTMNSCAAPCSPDNWGIADGSDRQPTELLDEFPATGPKKELGPVGASPSVALDDASNLWVFAGTGRLFDSSDQNDTARQYMVGVKDHVLNGLCTQSTRTNCHADDLLDVSGAEVCVIGVGDCGQGGGTDQVTGVTGATDFPSLVNLVKAKDGWVTSLGAANSGERSLSRPLVFGGLVIFPTFLPTGDFCAPEGESYLYVLYYKTGSAYSSPVIGTKASGGNETVNRATSLGKNIASQAVVHVGHGGSGGKSTAFLQKSSGEVTKIEFNSTGAVAIVSRFVTWYDVRQ